MSTTRSLPTDDAALSAVEAALSAVDAALSAVDKFQDLYTWHFIDESDGELAHCLDGLRSCIKHQQSDRDTAQSVLTRTQNYLTRWRSSRTPSRPASPDLVMLDAKFGRLEESLPSNVAALLLRPMWGCLQSSRVPGMADRPFPSRTNERDGSIERARADNCKLWAHFDLQGQQTKPEVRSAASRLESEVPEPPCSRTRSYLATKGVLQSLSERQPVLPAVIRDPEAQSAVSDFLASWFTSIRSGSGGHSEDDGIQNDLQTVTEAWGRLHTSRLKDAEKLQVP